LYLPARFGRILSWSFDISKSRVTRISLICLSRFDAERRMDRRKNPKRKLSGKYNRLWNLCLLGIQLSLAGTQSSFAV
jgi:hypothetical protein